MLLFSSCWNYLNLRHYFEVPPIVNLIDCKISLRRLVGLLPRAVAGLLMVGFMGACAANPPPAPPPPPPPPSNNYQAPASSQAALPSGEHLAGVGSETVVTVHGKIVSVDREKMMVTIVGPNGKPFPVHVYNPYNLAAAKPGEPFVARFYEIVSIRKKQPGEVLPATPRYNRESSAPDPARGPERLSAISCNWSPPSPRSIRSRTRSRVP